MMSMFVVIPLLSSVAVLIVIVNLLTLSTIFASPQLLKPSNYPIISFLVTALIQGFVVVPAYCIKRLDFSYKPKWICEVFRFPYFVCGHLLTLNLVLVCIDRIIAIKLPLRYESIVTRFSMGVSVIVETLFVVAIDLLPFANFAGHKQCVYNPWPSWSVTVIVLTILVPLVFLTLTYAWIWLIALRVADDPNKMKYAKGTPVKRKIVRRVTKILELRATKTASLLVGVFVLCWGPIAMYYLVENLCDHCITLLFSESSQRHISFSVKVVSFLSSIISPFAYCWRTREFQKEFQRNMTRRHWRAAGIAMSFLRRAARKENSEKDVQWNLPRRRRTDTEISQGGTTSQNEIGENGVCVMNIQKNWIVNEDCESSDFMKLANQTGKLSTVITTKQRGLDYAYIEVSLEGNQQDSISTAL